MYNDCLEVIREYYAAEGCGHAGNALESAIGTVADIYRAVSEGASLEEAFATVEPHFVADHDKHDVYVKRGVILESKNGSGSLQQCVSKAEAVLKAESADIQIHHATFVGYNPRFDMENLFDTTILTIGKFVQCLDNRHMARHKAKADGDYVSIQTVINEKYKTVYHDYYRFHGKSAYGFWVDLEANGEKVTDFMERMFGFRIPEEMFHGL